jgi:hypothetical protein
MIRLDRSNFLGQSPLSAEGCPGTPDLELRLMPCAVTTDAPGTLLLGAKTRGQAVTAPTITRAADHEDLAASKAFPLVALHSVRTGL